MKKTTMKKEKMKGTKKSFPQAMFSAKKAAMRTSKKNSVPMKGY